MSIVKYVSPNSRQEQLLTAPARSAWVNGTSSCTTICLSTKSRAMRNGT